MPTYEYVCRSCGHRFDVVQSIHDEPLQVCQECHGELRKVMNAVGVHFKGSGFYRTDSRTSKTGAPSAAKPAANEPGNTSAAKSTDTGSTSGTSSSSGSSGSCGSSGSADSAKASKPKPPAKSGDSA